MNLRVEVQPRVHRHTHNTTSQEQNYMFLFGQPKTSCHIRSPGNRFKTFFYQARREKSHREGFREKTAFLWLPRIGPSMSQARLRFCREVDEINKIDALQGRLHRNNCNPTMYSRPKFKVRPAKVNFGKLFCLEVSNPFSIDRISKN